MLVRVDFDIIFGPVFGVKVKILALYLDRFQGARQIQPVRNRNDNNTISGADLLPLAQFADFETRVLVYSYAVKLIL